MISALGLYPAFVTPHDETAELPTLVRSARRGGLDSVMELALELRIFICEEGKVIKVWGER